MVFGSRPLLRLVLSRSFACSSSAPASQPAGRLVPVAEPASARPKSSQFVRLAENVQSDCAATALALDCERDAPHQRGREKGTASEEKSERRELRLYVAIAVGAYERLDRLIGLWAVRVALSRRMRPLVFLRRLLSVVVVVVVARLASRDDPTHNQPVSRDLVRLSPRLGTPTTTSTTTITGCNNSQLDDAQPRLQATILALVPLLVERDLNHFGCRHQQT